MRIIAVDPSWEATGWASFWKGKLDECGVITNGGSWQKLAKRMRIARHHMHWNDDARVIIEVPVIRPQRVERANPNNLMKVAVVAGMALASFYSVTGEVEIISPQRWKGNRPKNVDNAYTLQLLSSPEKHTYKASVFELPAGIHNNVIDAIGIGLWAIKRR